MARLLLGNVEPGTSDEEIRDFLVKYGFPPFEKIELQPGSEAHPSMLLTFPEMEPSALFNLKERVHGLFWKKSKVTARIIQDRFA